MAKFVNKVGELVNDLEKTMKESTFENRKMKIIKWLRLAEEKWEIVIFVLQAIKRVEFLQKEDTSVLEVRDFIIQEGLFDAYLVESYIDGTFLIKKGKKGPIIKTILDNTVIWRILNPTIERAEFLELFDKNIEFFENEKSYSWYLCVYNTQSLWTN